VKLQKTLLATIAVASLLWTSSVQAHEPKTVEIDLTIEGSLTVDELGRFVLEGDLFLSGGFFDGLKVGRYECLSIPSVDPACDPVAAGAFGFNAASGVAVFTFGTPTFTLGSITTENDSCVVSTNLSTLEIDIVSDGVIPGGTGIFDDVSGTLDSSSTVSLATGAISVDVTLSVVLDD